MKYLYTFLLLLQNAQATDNNMIRSTFDALTELKPKPSSQHSAKKGVKVVFDKPDQESCNFVKKIYITEHDYGQLIDKSCASIIENISHNNDFKESDLLYIESVPLNCVPSTFYAQLYKCK